MAFAVQVDVRAVNRLKKTGKNKSWTKRSSFCHEIDGIAGRF